MSARGKRSRSDVFLGSRSLDVPENNDAPVGAGSHRCLLTDAELVLDETSAYACMLHPPRAVASPAAPSAGGGAAAAPPLSFGLRVTAIWRGDVSEGRNVWHGGGRTVHVGALCLVILNEVCRYLSALDQDAAALFAWTTVAARLRALRCGAASVPAEQPRWRRDNQETVEQYAAWKAAHDTWLAKHAADAQSYAAWLTQVGLHALDKNKDALRTDLGVPIGTPTPLWLAALLAYMKCPFVYEVGVATSVPLADQHGVSPGLVRAHDLTYVNFAPGAAALVGRAVCADVSVYHADESSVQMLVHHALRPDEDGDVAAMAYAAAAHATAARAPKPTVTTADAMHEAKQDAYGTVLRLLRVTAPDVTDERISALARSIAIGVSVTEKQREWIRRVQEGSQSSAAGWRERLIREAKNIGEPSPLTTADVYAAGDNLMRAVARLRDALALVTSVAQQAENFHRDMAAESIYLANRAATEVIRLTMDVIRPESSDALSACAQACLVLANEVSEALGRLTPETFTEDVGALSVQSRVCKECLAQGAQCLAFVGDGTTFPHLTPLPHPVPGAAAALASSDAGVACGHALRLALEGQAAFSVLAARDGVLQCGSAAACSVLVPPHALALLMVAQAQALSATVVTVAYKNGDSTRDKVVFHVEFNANQHDALHDACAEVQHALQDYLDRCMATIIAKQYNATARVKTARVKGDHVLVPVTVRCERDRKTFAVTVHQQNLNVDETSRNVVQQLIEYVFTYVATGQRLPTVNSLQVRLQPWEAALLAVPPRVHEVLRTVQWHMRQPQGNLPAEVYVRDAGMMLWQPARTVGSYVRRVRAWAEAVAVSIVRSHADAQSDGGRGRRSTSMRSVLDAMGMAVFAMLPSARCIALRDRLLQPYGKYMLFLRVARENGGVQRLSQAILTASCRPVQDDSDVRHGVMQVASTTWPTVSENLLAAGYVEDQTFGRATVECVAATTLSGVLAASTRLRYAVPGAPPPPVLGSVRVVHFTRDLESLTYVNPLLVQTLEALKYDPVTVLYMLLNELARYTGTEDAAHVAQRVIHRVVEDVMRVQGMSHELKDDTNTKEMLDVLTTSLVEDVQPMVPRPADSPEGASPAWLQRQAGAAGLLHGDGAEMLLTSIARDVSQLLRDVLLRSVTVNARLCGMVRTAHERAVDQAQGSAGYAKYASTPAATSRGLLQAALQRRSSAHISPRAIFERSRHRLSATGMPLLVTDVPVSPRIVRMVQRKGVSHFKGDSRPVALTLAQRAHAATQCLSDVQNLATWEGCDVRLDRARRDARRTAVGRLTLGSAAGGVACVLSSTSVAAAYMARVQIVQRGGDQDASSSSDAQQAEAELRLTLSVEGRAHHDVLLMPPDDVASLHATAMCGVVLATRTLHTYCVAVGFAHGCVACYQFTSAPGVAAATPTEALVPRTQRLVGLANEELAADSVQRIVPLGLLCAAPVVGLTMCPPLSNACTREVLRGKLALTAAMADGTIYMWNADPAAAPVQITTVPAPIRQGAVVARAACCDAFLSCENARLTTTFREVSGAALQGNDDSRLDVCRAAWSATSAPVALDVSALHWTCCACGTQYSDGREFCTYQDCVPLRNALDSAVSDATDEAHGTAGAFDPQQFRTGLMRALLVDRSDDSATMVDMMAELTVDAGAIKQHAAQVRRHVVHRPRACIRAADVCVATQGDIAYCAYVADYGTDVDFATYGRHARVQPDVPWSCADTTQTMQAMRDGTASTARVTPYAARTSCPVGDSRYRADACAWQLYGLRHLRVFILTRSPQDPGTLVQQCALRRDTPVSRVGLSICSETVYAVVTYVSGRVDILPVHHVQEAHAAAPHQCGARLQSFEAQTVRAQPCSLLSSLMQKATESSALHSDAVIRESALPSRVTPSPADTLGTLSRFYRDVCDSYDVLPVQSTAITQQQGTFPPANAAPADAMLRDVVPAGSTAHVVVLRHMQRNVRQRVDGSMSGMSDVDDAVDDFLHADGDEQHLQVEHQPLATVGHFCASVAALVSGSDLSSVHSAYLVSRSTNMHAGSGARSPAVRALGVAVGATARACKAALDLVEVNDHELHNLLQDPAVLMPPEDGESCDTCAVDCYAQTLNAALWPEHNAMLAKVVNHDARLVPAAGVAYLLDAAAARSAVYGRVDPALIGRSGQVLTACSRTRFECWLASLLSTTADYDTSRTHRRPLDLLADARDEHRLVRPDALSVSSLTGFSNYGDAGDTMVPLLRVPEPRPPVLPSLFSTFWLSTLPTVMYFNPFAYRAEGQVLSEPRPIMAIVATVDDVAAQMKRYAGNSTQALQRWRDIAGVQASRYANLSTQYPVDWRTGMLLVATYGSSRVRDVIRTAANCVSIVRGQQSDARFVRPSENYTASMLRGAKWRHTDMLDLLCIAQPPLLLDNVTRCAKRDRPSAGGAVAASDEAWQCFDWAHHRSAACADKRCLRDVYQHIRDMLQAPELDPEQDMLSFADVDGALHAAGCRAAAAGAEYVRASATAMALHLEGRAHDHLPHTLSNFRLDTLPCMAVFQLQHETAPHHFRAAADASSMRYCEDLPLRGDGQYTIYDHLQALLKPPSSEIPFKLVTLPMAHDIMTIPRSHREGPVSAEWLCAPVQHGALRGYYHCVGVMSQTMCQEHVLEGIGSGCAHVAPNMWAREGVPLIPPQVLDVSGNHNTFLPLQRTYVPNLQVFVATDIAVDIGVREDERLPALLGGLHQPHACTLRGLLMDVMCVLRHICVPATPLSDRTCYHVDWVSSVKGNALVHQKAAQSAEQATGITGDNWMSSVGSDIAWHALSAVYGITLQMKVRSDDSADTRHVLQGVRGALDRFTSWDDPSFLPYRGAVAVLQSYQRNESTIHVVANDVTHRAKAAIAKVDDVPSMIAVLPNYKRSAISFPHKFPAALHGSPHQYRNNGDDVLARLDEVCRVVQTLSPDDCPMQMNASLIATKELHQMTQTVQQYLPQRWRERVACAQTTAQFYNERQIPSQYYAPDHPGFRTVWNTSLACDAWRETQDLHERARERHAVDELE